MYQVIGCLTERHDLLLVATAAAVCVLASVAAFALLGRAEAARGWERRIWLGFAAVAAGGGTWATHFVAMLGYDPGLPAAYDLALTLASAGVAVAAAAAGLGLYLARPAAAAGRAAGGGVVGLGVGAMHYLGMAALRMPGRIVFDTPLVAISVALGAALAAMAFAAAPQGGGPRLLGRSATLAALIAAVAVAGLLAALLAALVEARLALAASAAEAARRLRELADATFEGIAICDGSRIAEANQQLAEFLGRPRDTVVGAAITDVLSPAGGSDLAALLAEARTRPAAAALVGAD